LGLKYVLACSAAIVALSTNSWAAPRLRLSQTVVGPVQTAQGSNPGNQVVYADNVGDGSLNLKLTSNVTWLQPTTGAPTDCSLRGICVPINIALRTNTLSPGIYSGVIAVTDPNAVDAPQTIVVTVQVGSGVPDKVELSLAPGASVQARFNSTNRLQVTSSVQGQGNWLAVAGESGGSFAFGNAYRISVNPFGLAAGDFTGQVVTSTSPVATENKTIPVTLKVSTFQQLEAAATNAPVAFAGGVVNNATFEGDTLAPGGIVAIFGDGFATGAPVSAQALPLTTELGGARVLVNDKAAPVYYVSPNQINFQLPYDTAAGDAIVRVERGGVRGNPVSINVGRAAPRILRMGIAEHGTIVFPDGVTYAIPRTAGTPSMPAKIGETVIVYAFGLGATTPAVASGVAAPSNPLGVTTAAYRVQFGATGPFGGGVQATPLYAGLTPNFVGLYQINVTIPEDAPRGDAVPVALVSDLEGSSNRVTMAIE
jgi:uncharacterized protein (TIGR03437 family)